MYVCNTFYIFMGYDYLIFDQIDGSRYLIFEFFYVGL